MRRTAWIRIALLLAAAFAAFVAVEASSANHISLVVSTAPDRQSPAPLDGASISGIVYIFSTPDEAEITSVEFFLDDPTLSGGTIRREGIAPYDLRGGTALVANPYDTNSIPDGPHTISIRVSFTNQSPEIVHASFTVANSAPSLVFSPNQIAHSLLEGYNAGPDNVTITASDATNASFVLSVPSEPWLTVVQNGSTTPASIDVSVDSTGLTPGLYTASIGATAAGLSSATLNVSLTVIPEPTGIYDLLVSASSNRAAPVLLDGQAVSGDIFVFTSPDTGVSGVRFYVDNPGMSGSEYHAEGLPPYDLEGGSASLANPFDTTALVDGPHSITAAIELSAGGTDVVTSSFTVANAAPALQATPGSVTFNVPVGGPNPVDQNVNVTASDASTPDVTISVPGAATWLDVTPLSGAAPLALQVSVDVTGLAEGPYSATVTASATGYIGDSFDVTLNVIDNTPPLTFSPNAVNLFIEEDSSVSNTPVTVFPLSGVATVALDTPVVDDWLSVNPVGGQSPLGFDVVVDVTGLALGSYTSSVTATAAGFDTAVLPVNLQVTAASFYYIATSSSPARLPSVPLNGAVVTGNIFVFTAPDTDVQRVSFYIDNPTRLGDPDHIENFSPFDLEGGSVSTANPFDTNSLADGQHSVTAELLMLDTTTLVLQADFTITNTLPALVLTPASLDLNADLDGSAVVGQTSLTTTGGAANFTVDVPAAAPWLDVIPGTGATPTTLDVTADPTGLAAGTYNATVGIQAPGFTPTNLAVSFEVVDNTPSLLFSTSSLDFSVAEEGLAPDQAVLLSASAGLASFTVDIPAAATWLGVNPSTGSTSQLLDFSIDATGLVAGTYAADVTASAPGFNGDSITITLRVGAVVDLFVSTSSDRSSPVPLDGQTVDRDIFVFTSPDSPDITQVRFYLDDPSFSFSPYRTENFAPYDLAGGTVFDATPFDSGSISDGQHTISARVTSQDPITLVETIEVLHATFIVLNNLPQVVFTPSAVEFQLAPDDTASVDVSVSATDGQAVAFALSGVTEPWINVLQVDPATPGTVRISVDATGLANGVYGSTVTTSASGYLNGSLDVTLRIGGSLAYFAGDDVHDTAVSIVGTDWYINGQPTYQGRFWNGNRIEGLLMNSRMANAIFDDLDGVMPSQLLPFTPRSNTEDFIANMEAYRDHGLLAFNVDMQGGGVIGFTSHPFENNPYGSNGTKAFDDWDLGLSTPESEYLRRLGSIIRHADDLGMVVEVSLFYWREEHFLADEAAVIAATDATIDWILDNGWTNVIIEAANESSWSPSNFQYEHEILQPTRIVEIMDRIKTRSSGAAGAHLPEGRLLVTVSGHGSFVPYDHWIVASDYVTWHGNGAGESTTRSQLDQIAARQVYIDNPKPIYTNEASTRLDVVDDAVARHTSWGYYNGSGYQRIYPDTDSSRWTIGKGSAWWSLLSSITGISP